MVKIRIIVKDLKGKQVKLEVNTSDSISYGKKIYSKLINSSESFKWNFNGMILNNDKTFEYYEMKMMT